MGPTAMKDTLLYILTDNNFLSPLHRMVHTGYHTMPKTLPYLTRQKLISKLYLTYNQAHQIRNNAYANRNQSEVRLHVVESNAQEK